MFTPCREHQRYAHTYGNAVVCLLMHMHAGAQGLPPELLAGWAEGPSAQLACLPLLVLLKAVREGPRHGSTRPSEQIPHTASWSSTQTTLLLQVMVSLAITTHRRAEMAVPEPVGGPRPSRSKPAKTRPGHIGQSASSRPLVQA